MTTVLQTDPGTGAGTAVNPGGPPGVLSGFRAITARFKQTIPEAAPDHGEFGFNPSSQT
jgi:hypothetical protein